MTTKQIAEATSKPEKTVRNWAAKTSAKLDQVRAKLDQAAKTKKPADFDLDETCAIIESGMGKNAAALYRANANSTGNAMAEIARGDEVAAVEALAKIAEALGAISTAVQALSKRVLKIEDRIDQRQALLPAPQIDPKTAVNKLLREHVAKDGGDYRAAWSELYREFGYRTRTNPSQCAKNRGMAIIDYIEAEGQVETLLAVAMDMWGGAA